MDDLKRLARLVVEAEAREDIEALEAEMSSPLSTDLEKLRDHLLLRDQEGAAVVPVDGDDS